MNILEVEITVDDYEVIVRIISQRFGVFQRGDGQIGEYNGITFTTYDYPELDHPVFFHTRGRRRDLDFSETTLPFNSNHNAIQFSEKLAEAVRLFNIDQSLLYIKKVRAMIDGVISLSA